MLWWMWLAGGIILFGAELFFVNAEFYLVFVGAAAIVTGLAALAWGGLPAGAQWSTFAVLTVVSMVGFRRRLYERLRGNPPAVQAGPQGDEFTLAHALAPGEQCQIEHAGSYWTIRNDSAQALAAGARVRVAAVDGMTLRVEPA